MLTSFKPLQPLNADSPIDVRVVGSFNSVNFSQFLKADAPIVVTPLGMLIFSRFLHPLNALSEILLIVLESVTLVTFSLP